MAPQAQELFGTQAVSGCLGKKGSAGVMLSKPLNFIKRFGSVFYY